MKKQWRASEDDTIKAVAERLAEIEYGHTVKFGNLTRSERDAFIGNAKSVAAVFVASEDAVGPMRMAVDAMVDAVCETAKMTRNQLIYGRDRETCAARAAAGFLCRYAIEPRPTLHRIARAVFGREDSGTAHNRITKRHVNPYTRVLVEQTCERLNIPAAIMEKYDRVPAQRPVAQRKNKLGAGAVCGGGGGTSA
jgi:hypothetical protein